MAFSDRAPWVWDYDPFFGPNLVSLNVDGRNIEAVAEVPSKGSRMYLTG
ncbi:MAG: hypothetical protein Ct9H300mP25_04700 [Acidobacteriota bacterium]|nr:MAG: hypothetical protein Ct9H300mP25_04700 [Acidobacteriota bacterium]